MGRNGTNGLRKKERAMETETESPSVKVNISPSRSRAQEVRMKVGREKFIHLLNQYLLSA